MYNYNEQVQAYEDDCVNLPQPIKDKLRDHRDANRRRLKKNRPSRIRLNDDHFIPQGSMAIGTTIQDKENAYDIDDGVWFHADDLKKENGDEMSAGEVQEMVRDALNDPCFSKRPKIQGNCFRVFYAEGHHVDVPSYRLFNHEQKDEKQELRVNRRRRTNFMGFVPSSSATRYTRIVLEQMLMRKNFPRFSARINGLELICRGRVRPVCEASEFRVEIRYCGFASPDVRILAPKIEEIVKVHRFRDGTLCLFDYRDQPWQQNWHLHETVVPWTCEWLVYFEIFCLTGKWLGKSASHDTIPEKPPVTSSNREMDAMRG